MIPAKTLINFGLDIDIKNGGGKLSLAGIVASNGDVKALETMFKCKEQFSLAQTVDTKAPIQGRFVIRKSVNLSAFGMLAQRGDYEKCAILAKELMPLIDTSLDPFVLKYAFTSRYKKNNSSSPYLTETYSTAGALAHFMAHSESKIPSEIYKEVHGYGLPTEEPYIKTKMLDSKGETLKSELSIATIIINSTKGSPNITTYKEMLDAGIDLSDEGITTIQYSNRKKTHQSLLGNIVGRMDLNKKDELNDLINPCKDSRVDVNNIITITEENKRPVNLTLVQTLEQLKKPVPEELKKALEDRKEGSRHTGSRGKKSAASNMKNPSDSSQGGCKSADKKQTFSDFKDACNSYVAYSKTDNSEPDQSSEYKRDDGTVYRTSELGLYFVDPTKCNDICLQSTNELIKNLQIKNDSIERFATKISPDGTKTSLSFEQTLVEQNYNKVPFSLKNSLNQRSATQALMSLSNSK